MGSLIGELGAREAAARARVETLVAEPARLTARLEDERPDCWRYLVEVDGAGKLADATGYR
ncbi:hypothetical protein ACIRLA_15750 [Streptomyces sp. NPDC102364]|uniref:hypothetical protein n=1 Tax=Streptomyces sp. NPDC102364 TaxID=3366161 RepID=UPI00381DB398